MIRRGRRPKVAKRGHCYAVINRRGVVILGTVSTSRYGAIQKQFGYCRGRWVDARRERGHVTRKILLTVVSPFD